MPQHIISAFSGFLMERPGEVKHSACLPDSIIHTNNYIVQGIWSGGCCANAIFDELRIWNVARDASQRATDMDPIYRAVSAGLVGYWH
jgi:hypothetical protein